MAGAYYPPGAYPAPQDDFEDYMWMENEEEFDKQVSRESLRSSHINRF